MSGLSRVSFVRETKKPTVRPKSAPAIAPKSVALDVKSFPNEVSQEICEKEAVHEKVSSFTPNEVQINVSSKSRIKPLKARNDHSFLLKPLLPRTTLTTSNADFMGKADESALNELHTKDGIDAASQKTSSPELFNSLSSEEFSPEYVDTSAGVAIFKSHVDSTRKLFANTSELVQQRRRYDFTIHTSSEIAEREKDQRNKSLSSPKSKSARIPPKRVWKAAFDSFLASRAPSTFDDADMCVDSGAADMTQAPDLSCLHSTRSDGGGFVENFTVDGRHPAHTTLGPKTSSFASLSAGSRAPLSTRSEYPQSGTGGHNIRQTSHGEAKSSDDFAKISLQSKPNEISNHFAGGQQGLGWQPKSNSQLDVLQKSAITSPTGGGSLARSENAGAQKSDRGDPQSALVPSIDLSTLGHAASLLQTKEFEDGTGLKPRAATIGSVFQTLPRAREEAANYGLLPWHHGIEGLVLGPGDMEEDRSQGQAVDTETDESDSHSNLDDEDDDDSYDGNIAKLDLDMAAAVGEWSKTKTTLSMSGGGLLRKRRNAHKYNMTLQEASDSDLSEADDGGYLTKGINENFYFGDSAKIR